MSTPNRSKYKATSVAATKQADKAVEAVTGKGDRGPSADYHKIDPGMNYHRIYPPHPEDGGELYAVPKGVHWIPQEVPKKDKDGKFEKDKDGKQVFEVKVRPIFNAKIHAGKKKDICEEYSLFAEKVAKELFPTESDEDKKGKYEYLLHVLGNPQAKIQGIGLKQSWVSYSDKMKVDKDGTLISKFLGRLESGKAVKYRLNSLAATETSNDPLGTDPFTDLEDGRAISINYNDKATKPQDYYATEFYAPLIPGGKGQIRLYPITDDDLAKFETYPSLKKLFVNVYDRKTFDTALKGLKMLDEQYELGVFEYDEWLKICNELQSEFPEVGEETKTDKSEEEEGESGDIYDDMERDELKAFIKDRKLTIIVNKKMTDDDIRKSIREELVLDPEEENEEEEESEEEEGEESSEKDETKSDPKKAAAKKTVEEPKGDLPWEKDEKKEESTSTGKVAETVKERMARLKAEREAKAAGK